MRAEVIGVDTDMASVEPVRDRLTVAAQVDAIEVDTLREVGAQEVDAAVVAIGDDFAAEVLAVAVLREIGIAEIVARATNERERRILSLVGATRIVAVEVEMGKRVARMLAGRHVVDYVPLGEGLSVIHWTADERVVGRRLAEADLRPRWNLILLAVRRPDEPALTILPPPEYVFQAGDILLLAGADAHLDAFTH
jgi:trk system potassium uptake protein TrkA